MIRIQNIVEAFLADDNYTDVSIQCLTKDKADELRDQLRGHTAFDAEVKVSENLGMHLPPTLTGDGNWVGWDYASRQQTFAVVLTKKVHNGK